MHVIISKFKHYKKKFLTAISCLTFICSTAFASDLTIPNTFVANQPAIAAQVNANFNAVETSVDDNNSRLAGVEAMITTMQATISSQQTTINSLQSTNTNQQTAITNLQSVNTSQQTTINQLQSDLTTVENNTVLELDGLLRYALIDGHNTAEFTDVNVQINNGSGTTGTINGKGNLTIGYHETTTLAPFFCSDPQYTDSVSCIGNLETWAQNVRTGSHNLILGIGQSYTNSSAILAGSRNVSNALFASVYGGVRNIATGSWSSVLGGSDNSVTGTQSVILGGARNVNSGFASTITGGDTNTILNPVPNSGAYASILGGFENSVTGNWSTISGGTRNSSIGFYSSISGGRDNNTTGVNSTVSGGGNNTSSGSASNVSGGFNRTASGSSDWVAGSLFEDQ